MNPSAPLVLLACGLLATAVAVSLWWSIDEPDLTTPGRQKPMPILDNRVDLPPMLSFAAYYGDENTLWRENNPFIPHRKRVEERKTRLADTSPSRPPPVNADLRPPVRPNKQPMVVTPPVRHYPAFGDDSETVPNIIGQIQSPEEAILQVSFAGQDLRMQPGDSVGEWQLLRAETSFAWFRDPDGEERQLPIGMKPTETMVLAPDGADGDGDEESDEDDTSPHP